MPNQPNPASPLDDWTESVPGLAEDVSSVVQVCNRPFRRCFRVWDISAAPPPISPLWSIARGQHGAYEKQRKGLNSPENDPDQESPGKRHKESSPRSCSGDLIVGWRCPAFVIIHDDVPRRSRVNERLRVDIVRLGRCRMGYSYRLRR